MNIINRIEELKTELTFLEKILEAEEFFKAPFDFQYAQKQIVNELVKGRTLDDNMKPLWVLKDTTKTKKVSAPEKRDYKVKDNRNYWVIDAENKRIKEENERFEMEKKEKENSKTYYADGSCEIKSGPSSVFIDRYGNM